ncbi:hypothetical protein IKG29_00755 [Candidatus Saccharibacteria bacterium]|nr:hypothetical protein [Candidatus Saccharibacteria bacterium]
MKIFKKHKYIVCSSVLLGIFFPILISATTNAAPSPFDDVFYECYIKGSFSSEFPDEDIPDEGLSDEQLAKIKTVSGHCGTADPNLDVTGLEKLTNLETLIIRNLNVQNLDLSSNLKLETLELSNTGLTDLDLSYVPITTLNLDGNDDLDVVDNVNLFSLRDLSSKDNIILNDDNTVCDDYSSDGILRCDIFAIGLLRVPRSEPQFILPESDDYYHDEELGVLAFNKPTIVDNRVQLVLEDIETRTKHVIIRLSIGDNWQPNNSPEGGAGSWQPNGSSKDELSKKSNKKESNIKTPNTGDNTNDKNFLQLATNYILPALVGIITSVAAFIKLKKYTK